MTTEDERHMPWPGHDHDQYGECRIELTQGDYITVTLQGVPCDSCSIEVGALLTEPAEVTWLRSALDQLEPLLVSGRAEAHCEGHDHPDDE